MTPKQSKEFIGAAALGISLGLQHRYEWYTCAIRALQHGPYTEINKRHYEITNAFVAFEKRLATCTEEKEELDKLDALGFINKVSCFYNEAQTAPR